jgi:hypothetical protein
MGDESFGLDDERAGNISNGSLKVGSVSLENLEEEEEESDGEIEYMPPKATRESLIQKTNPTRWRSSGDCDSITG